MYKTDIFSLQGTQTSDSFNLHPFELEDRAFLQTFLDQYRPLSCEYNFSNLFIWQNPAKLSWTMYKDNLLIYDGIEKRCFMPVGQKLCPEELLRLSENMQDIGLGCGFTLVTKDYIDAFPEVKDNFIIKLDYGCTEYIYDAQKLCGLNGKKLTKKRNLISQFKRLYGDYKIDLIKENDLQNILEFSEQLLKRKNSVPETLCMEFEAIRQALLFFTPLNLAGLLLSIKNQIVGFAVFSPLDKSTFDIHFEKSDLEFKGVAQLITNETAKYLKDKCKFLNKEQDLGIKGLKRAKLSWEPEILLDFYSLIPNVLS
jgi:hypothetical protein